jgi:hypothetical protein
MVLVIESLEGDRRYWVLGDRGKFWVGAIDLEEAIGSDAWLLSVGGRAEVANRLS